MSLPLARLTTAALTVTAAIVIAVSGSGRLIGAPLRITVTLDQEARGTFGLAPLAAVHRTLYDSSRERFRFSHHPNAVIYQDRLYVMWSNALESEDENGQRVLCTSSGDGDNWSEPGELIPDPDGEAGPLCAVAAGFHVNGGVLVVHYSSMVRGSPAHVSSVYAVASENGRNWSKPVKIVDGFFIENLRRLPSGRILMGGQSDASVRLIYTDSPLGMSGWKHASIPPFPDFVYRSGYPEPNWFLRCNGTIVMLFRAIGGNPWMYVSVSRNEGASWSAPARTNLPSTTVRMSVGNLPDGRAFCIWNPSQKFGRNPLVTALSSDGVDFDSAFVLRGEPTTQKFAGERKSNGWQYPSSVIWRDALWVAYSVNKEDVMISRVKLVDLDGLTRPAE